MRPGVYVRVSSQDQVEGFSLDAQRRLTTEYCAAQGWPAPRVFADEGISAYVDEIERRPAFAAALAAAEAGEITHLLTIEISCGDSAGARNLSCRLGSDDGPDDRNRCSRR